LLPVFVARESEVRSHIITNELVIGLRVLGLEIDESSLGLNVLIHEERDIVPSKALVE
jgi:hypothetical protein